MKRIVLIVSVAAALVLLIVLLGYFLLSFFSTPGNIYKRTLDGCDSVGYGYKGMCYGNIAYKENNKSICSRIPEEEGFNRQKCLETYQQMLDDVMLD